MLIIDKGDEISLFKRSVVTSCGDDIDKIEFVEGTIVLYFKQKGYQPHKLSLQTLGLSSYTINDTVTSLKREDIFNVVASMLCHAPQIKQLTLYQVIIQSKEINELLASYTTRICIEHFRKLFEATYCKNKHITTVLIANTIKEIEQELSVILYNHELKLVGIATITNNLIELLILFSQLLDTNAINYGNAW